MDSNAVADSTDWLETPLPGLAPLESSLRCQVCKEVFTTPMITSCSHTFCSLCIRRYLSQEGKCPSCRTPDQEMKLRHNWAVQELVEIWSENRDKIFAFAKTAATTNGLDEETKDERPKKRRKVDEPPVVVQKSGLEERRSTRSQSRRAASQASQSIRSLPSTQEEEVADSDAGSVYADSPRVDSRHFPAAEPHDGLVGCPNCTRRMKEAQINTHLDKCLQGIADSPTPPPPLPNARNNHAPSPSRSFQAGTIAYTTTKPTTSTNQRLPTINYNINDNALRKKLKDLGIPNHGTKETLRKRHTEWMNLWNANCDSLHPAPKAKLLRELDVWERNFTRDERQRQQASGPGGGGSVNGGSGMMDKEFDREGYMRKEKEGFEDLIRKARESRKAKAAAAVAAEDSAASCLQVEPAEHKGSGEAGANDPIPQYKDVNGLVQGLLQPSQSTDIDVNMTNGDSSLHHNLHQEVLESTRAFETLVPSTPPRSNPSTKGPVFVDSGYRTADGTTAVTADQAQAEPIDLVTPEKAWRKV